MTSYEPVIGLEVHAQLLVQTKMFCGCSTHYGAPVNTNICPVCLGLPGALPVPNKEAMRLAVRAALALGCTVNPRSIFARKNYFYPDLSKGYQISQFDKPMNEHGLLDIEIEGATKRVGITRIHVEEDAAKNLHGVGSAAETRVDFNRGGVPLIEIVGEPDLRSSAEAEAYLKRLREILMFMGVNDGNLEEGSFRCDANVSIRPVGAQKFGTRVELKNINSFRFVRKAIDSEIARQESIISAGGSISQETRTWSEAHGKTLPMRSKEEAHDYRYFPDPDLPPLSVAALLDEVKATMPEHPDAKRERWVRDLGLTPYDAQVLSAHPAIACYFDNAVSAATQDDASNEGRRREIGKRVANFVQAEVLRFTTTNGLEAKFPVTSDGVAELLHLIEKGTISGKMAKDVFAEMHTTGRGAQTVVASKGLSQITDTSVLESAAREAIAQNPGQVEKYKAGKGNVLGFFVGQVMKTTKGAGNPAIVNEILVKLLSQ